MTARSQAYEELKNLDSNIDAAAPDDDEEKKASVPSPPVSGDVAT